MSGPILDFTPRWCGKIVLGPEKSQYHLKITLGTIKSQGHRKITLGTVKNLWGRKKSISELEGTWCTKIITCLIKLQGTWKNYETGGGTSGHQNRGPEPDSCSGGGGGDLAENRVRSSFCTG